MTIGAQPGAGGVRFRVWAPAATAVDVVLYGPSAESIHPLESEGGGYFGGVVAEARVGSRYRYRLDGESAWPDPASRSQPDGVHGPSEVVDPDAYPWRSAAHDPPSLADLVLYELHIGTFTRAGTFRAAAERLPYLAELGVTAVEVMPIANFPGERNWGYDGVNLFAPATAYGGVADFKSFVDAAHENGLAVILDVVYNHLGPEGNYLPVFTGGRFFTERHSTPWGPAVNFDGPDSRPVRDFVLQNAIHWFQEYRIDGLRLDATHALVDDSEVHILEELASFVAALPGPRRFLIAEDERNETRLVLPRESSGFGLDAVWADDLHHQIRRAVAGDEHGYFAEYTGTTADIAETLRRGWWRELNAETPGDGDPSGRVEEVPPTSLIHCIQNHDQVGNRATGERLNHQIPLPVYRAISTLLLTSPYTPLLWMGQEWAASSPFLYFTDHPHELGRLVSEGRREEFKHFPEFRELEGREAIPDPQVESTFLASKLRWEEKEEPPHAGVLALYRELLDLRRSHPAMRDRNREAFAVDAVGEGAILLARRTEGRRVLVVVNLLGEIRLDLARLEGAASGAEGVWLPLLISEDVRFGGTGGWGRLEPDGTLHLVEPGAIVLEAGD